MNKQQASIFMRQLLVMMKRGIKWPDKLKSQLRDLQAAKPQPLGPEDSVT